MQPIRNRSPLPIDKREAEQRRRGRLRCLDLWCRLSVHGAEDLAEPTKAGPPMPVENLSATGVRLRYTGWHRLHEGQIVPLWLEWAEYRLAVEAQVRWVRRVGFRKRTVGLAFVNLTPDRQRGIETLGEYARSAMATW